MTIANIVAGVNAKLAGETLTYNQMRLFLNEVVDKINEDLSANFPSFDEISQEGVYEFFPDKYIRSVIMNGAAYRFYVTDEEGAATAMQYKFDYLDALFAMKRDYSCKVPTEYQDTDRGYVSGPELIKGIETGFQGWW